MRRATACEPGAALVLLLCALSILQQRQPVVVVYVVEWVPNARLRSRLVLTPAQIDDDRAALKILREKAATGEAYIISNDTFKDHKVDDILKDRHVRIMWVDNRPMLLPPEGVELPGL